MTKSENDAKKEAAAAVEDDDEPDDWDQRIINTGCAAENTKMTDCYFDHKDWTKCSKELAQFRKCWMEHQNDKRTAMKDV